MAQSNNERRSDETDKAGWAIIDRRGHLYMPIHATRTNAIAFHVAWQIRAQKPRRKQFAPHGLDAQQPTLGSISQRRRARDQSPHQLGGQMSKRKFRLGALTVDAQAYGNQGNAILGIRDSGKTYTATEIAEHLFDAGVPFITFDPTGAWRFLRVPGLVKGRAGRGYPIVVAGGKSAEWPVGLGSTATLLSSPKSTQVNYGGGKA
jgi:hypothetical protein